MKKVIGIIAVCSPAYQQNAITEFQNRVTLECLKSYAK
jgi:hypothetical protein